MDIATFELGIGACLKAVEVGAAPGSLDGHIATRVHAVSDATYPGCPLWWNRSDELVLARSG